MSNERTGGARPAEHEVRPVDPKSADAANLRSLAERFHAEVERPFRSDPRTFSTSERIDPRREIARRAESFSLNLREYWAYAVGYANDTYRYGSKAGERELRELNSSLKDVDRKLDTQLQKWEEATSPFTDHYEVGEIFSAGQDLLVTLRNAAKQHAVPETVRVDDPQRVAEAGFDMAIGAALAGLSKQIGDRLSALGSGHTVERITMSSQTSDTLKLAATDRAAEKLKSAAASAETFRDSFVKEPWTGDRILALQTTSRELSEKLRAESLPADAINALETQRDQIERVLESLRGVIDAVPKSAAEQQRIQDARDAVSGLDRKLKMFALTPEARAEVLKDRAAAAKAVAELEAPFLKGALEVVKTRAADSQGRFDLYTQRLDEARADAKKDQTAYWETLQGQFLGEIEALLPDLRKELGTALDLTDALKEWKKQLAPKVTLDPAGLQNAATSLLRAIDACSARTELAMGRSAGDPTVMAALRDELNSGLAAIRESVAKDLTFLFKSGIFGRREMLT